MKKTYKPGDEVWVAQALEGRMRPIKLKIFAVQTIDFGNRTDTTYFGPNGTPLEAAVYGTIEMCEKAINVMEHHRAEFTTAMDALEKEMSGGAQLVDATGKKMV